MNQPTPEPGPIPDYFPDVLPMFASGDCVRHLRYGYRGVVVDFDMRCLAGEGWYEANATRPNREQPWYHVLVDGADATTYVAESHLIADDSGMAVQHPLVDEFFAGHDGRRYVRNDLIWPMG